MSIVEQLRFRSSCKDGIGFLPDEIVHVPARLLHLAIDDITRLTADVERLIGERDRQYDYNAEMIARYAALEAENERLRAALEEIIALKVFGFAITAVNGKDVYCEGTNRFVREEEMIKTRKIARAALATQEKTDV